MKIGVITWFREENYGTILQAFALQKYLKKIGVNPELINFEIPEKSKRKIKVSSLYDFWGKIANRLDHIIHRRDYKNKSIYFKKFIDDNCILSKKVDNEKEYINLCNEYNTIICGSDQIWNPNWYHPFYYCNYNEITSNIISYAPSFGVNKIPSEYEAKYKEALNKMSKISVREQNGKEIVFNLIEKNPNVVVDPTFLLSAKEWDKFCDSSLTPSFDYILCYMLSDNINHWKAIKRFAKSKKMKLIVIPHNGFSCIESKYIMRYAGPSNFIDLIKHSKYMVTDSFHGTVFSIIFKKQFILFERHNPKSKTSQNSRLYSILSLSNLEDRMVHFNSKFIPNMKDITYSNINNDNINKMILNSKDFLADGLNIKENK